MINHTKVFLVIISFPAFGVWISWYLEAWDIMIICLLLTIPIITIDAYFTRDARTRIKDTAIMLLLNLPLVIYAFAKLYEQHGLLHNGDIVHSLSASLYFSIVTWTTLGYGDYQPTENIQIWAATEALFGYVFMALLIALIINLLASDRKNA